MPNNRTTLIATLGLSQQDQGVSDRLFQLTISQTRSCSYALTHVTATPPPDIILVVNADDQNAQSEWQMLCDNKPTRASLPMVGASQAVDPLDTQNGHIQRPFLAPRGLRTLDSITIQNKAETSTAPSSMEKALIMDDSLPVRKQAAIELRHLEIQDDLAENSTQVFTSLK